MIDQHTIALMRKISVFLLIGWAIFATCIVLLLCVIALLLQITLMLLQVVNTTTHEIMRLYGLQPSLIQLLLLGSLVVLSVWIFARLWGSLLRAGAYLKDAYINEKYRRGRTNGR